jgi:hypothetical protein
MVRHGEGESRLEPVGHGFDDALARFAADVRAEGAVDARRRERWLRHQAAEEASLVATCWNLAEVGAVVSVTLRSGRARTGSLRVIGADFVVMVDPAGREHLMPLAAVTALGPLGPEGERAGTAARERAEGEPTGRPRRAGARLAEVLAALAGDRALVRLHADGLARPVVGELHSVGRDVLVVDGDARHGGDTPARLYVRLSSVAELSLMASG